MRPKQALLTAGSGQHDTFVPRVSDAARDEILRTHTPAPDAASAGDAQEQDTPADYTLETEIPAMSYILPREHGPVAASMPTPSASGQLQRSTPIKRKAASIPISLQADFDLYSKRARLASTITSLMRSDLDGCTYQCRNFLAQFLGVGSLGSDKVQSLGILDLLSQEGSLGNSIRYLHLDDKYICTPPSYANTHFPNWFCKLANFIASCTVDNEVVQIATPEAAGTRFPGPSGRLRAWLDTKNTTLLGAGHQALRPDFILTTEPSSPSWFNVLVVGEHQSKKGSGSSRDSAMIQLASYAEQVFVVQPFRSAVLGILTSNMAPCLTFWRFDRAGAIRSLPLSYGSTTFHLEVVIQALAAVSQMPAIALGFHVSSISWDFSQYEYPVDEKSQFTIQVPVTNRDADEENSISLQKLLFVAPGIVTRGTRVWQGIMGEKSVVIKYSWRSTKRDPEARWYQIAASQGVVGIPELIACDTYEDIFFGVRPSGFTSNKTVLEAYNRHIQTHNRTMTRLVLSPMGSPISTSALTPLQVARALLAALIGHASLFFQAGILHRDISPNNIISMVTPVAVSHPSPEWLCATPTNLYGCLIDLDYAIDASELTPSGAADRTGTYPFIAIRVLLGEEVHRYRHDLESILYVLLWVSCYPRPPGQQSTITTSARPGVEGTWPVDDPLYLWTQGDVLTVTSHKTTHIVSSATSFARLLERFRPGFESFRRTAFQFRKLLWALPGSSFCSIVPERVANDAGNLNSSINDRDALLEEFDGGLLGPEEVRIGVDNRRAYLEARAALEKLVATLEGV